MNIVWFKRDLRIEDNAVLHEASQRGVVLPLYILEPELWHQPDLSLRHYQFLLECLDELDRSLRSLGQPLVIKVGSAVNILRQLHTQHQIEGVWSHQETWNGWTYTRDKQVKIWLQSQAIKWHEPVQNGVVRRLKDRTGWAAQWQSKMKQAIVSPPQKLISISAESDLLPTAEQLGLQPDDCAWRQKGGRQAALQQLHSFLNLRGQGYTKEMSSPVTAYESCSRLSPHLAFGTISMREVYHAAEQRSREVWAMSATHKGSWPSAIRSFSGRLRWHCHFIQKLEDEPRIEFENLHPAYDGLRENQFNQTYFEAWQRGETGYPMVDACMRALIATGWLNFRMRAMLMSFASYHLWLHWREPALYLARLFTDYEPGIHYSQVQMQSGTTGINSIRIYNPIKQGVDHDPEGKFIRQWIPELAHIPDAFIHTPWLSGVQLNSYPMPIVDEKQARKAAADVLYGLRKQPQHKASAKRIVNKHGSRKSGLPRTTRRESLNIVQMELPL